LSNVTRILNELNLTQLVVPVDALVEGVLNTTTLPSAIAANYTVVEGFDVPNGKFGDTLGNMALIDCHWVPGLFLNTWQRYFDALTSAQPVYFLALSSVHTQAKELINDLDFCKYAPNIAGVMTNQVDTYTGSKQNMQNSLGQAGNKIMDQLSLDSNVTVTTPLKSQLNQVQLITVFFNSIMTTIVLFLAILCTQLIYSLMLSDVEEKTFEFGMLRALGFNTKNITITIVVQAFTFALPGLITGILLSSVLNLGVRSFLYWMTNNYSDYWVSKGAIWFGCIIGIFMPLVSNIVPI
jgi:ABC-type antimicrobial peptide transport system permease subunit